MLTETAGMKISPGHSCPCELKEEHFGVLRILTSIVYRSLCSLT